MAAVLTERQQRVFDSIGRVHGEWVRWERKFYLPVKEPVTREINALAKKGILEIWSSGFGIEISLTEEGRRLYWSEE